MMLRQRAAGMPASMALVLLAAFLGWGACGGGSSAGGAQEPGGMELADDEEPAEESALIPVETLEQLQSFFQRKNRVIARCFTAAMEAEEIPANVSQVHVTAAMTITEDGRATRISFTDATVRSPALEACLREHIGGWILPSVPRPLDFSHTFGFSAL